MPPAPVTPPDRPPPDAAVPAPDPDDELPPPPPILPIPPPTPQPGVTAVLDIHPMDVWAQYLPEGATLLVSRDLAEVVRDDGFPVTRVPLHQAGEYTIELSAPEHEPLTVRVRYDGSGRLDGARVTANDGSGRAGVLLAHDVETLVAGQPPVAVHRLFLGLRHRWFATTGRPARRGNKLQLLMDGEEAWGQVHRDLPLARERIHLTTWWWDSTFELVRPLATHATMTSEERRRNTILWLLEQSPAHKRVLVWQMLTQDGLLSWLTSDQAVRAYGARAGDRFDFMGQANETAGTFLFSADAVSFASRVRAAVPGISRATLDPTPELAAAVPSHEVSLKDGPIKNEMHHASWHQKLITIDGKIAFVGGMNLTNGDWDSSAHRVFDPRRMPFSASAAERRDVAAKKKLPAQVPAKDYMVRIEGPAVEDVDHVFKLRWDLSIDERVEYAANATRFDLRRALPPAGGVQAQITTTMPDPLWEHSIAESWLNAVGQARHYIYIEDQYFRAPILNDAIARRMRQVPGLRLVVVTRRVGEWTDLGCAWTARSHAFFQREFPTRYKILQLRAFDSVVTWGIDETEARYVDLYTHSKMLIIDDVFMSVGSANKNNRGMIYEGEMNVAVHDATWVRAARRRIFANLMPGLAATDDVATWWDQLGQCQAWNDYVHANWERAGGDIDLDGAPLPEKYTPFGLLHSLDVPLLEECLFEDIGADMT
jgi:phosphatidylserine/phosphatidylglycerophosphate/cardiolipin synthase-like enzyme